jgi:hypothetical protein
MRLEDSQAPLEDFATRVQTSAEVGAWLETLTNGTLATLVEDTLAADVPVLSPTWDLLMEVVDRLRGAR